MTVMDQDTPDLTRVKQTCFDLSTALNLAYGKEAGLGIWEKMVSQLPEGLQNDLLFECMKNGMRQTITVTDLGDDRHYISAIKAVRTITGAGLKEAVDLVRPLKDAGTSFTIELFDESYFEAQKIFRDIGCTVE